ncbi:MAG: hypothetical protein MJE77_46075 [Proteobacteria bacterium]|nr:hypothetical protein [Pseudomonadota bacterium]
MHRFPSIGLACDPGSILRVVVCALVLVGMASGPARASQDVTVAVLYFDYNGTSEDMAFLRKGLAQMLVSDLVGTPGVTVVERMKLEQVLAELDLNRSKRIDRRSALRVGKLLGARYLVAGSYTVYKQTMILSLRVLEVETGKIVIGGQNHRGKFDEFWQMEQTVAAQLRAIMSERLTRPRAASRRPGKRNAGTGKPGQKKPRKTLHAKTAARYGKALDAMDKGDKKAAKSELEAIVKDQPDFELASLDLASLAR